MTQPKKWQRVDRKTCIYALADPVSGEVRYIGKTTQKGRSRLATHVAHSRKFAQHDRRYWVLHWVNALVVKGLRPELFELEIVEPWGDWCEAECFWIDVMRSWGFELCNVRPGGQAGNFTKQSAETIEKRVSKLRGRPGRKPTEGEKVRLLELLARGRATRSSWSPERRIAATLAARYAALAAPRPKGANHPKARAVIIDGKRYHTVFEAVRQIGVTRRTIYNWLRDGAAFYVSAVSAGTAAPVTFSEFRASKPKRVGRPIGFTLSNRKSENS